MKTKSAIVGNGSTTHIGIVNEDGKMTSVLCGAEFSKNQNQRYAEVYEANEKYKTVTCKRCLKSSQASNAK